MKDGIAFMLVMTFALLADGLMDKGIAVLLVAAALMLGTACVLVCADWRNGK
jgi:hypothetical protein